METIPVFEDTCPQCGDYSLEQIPDAPVMLSYPAQYHVKCRRCGVETTSRKLSEVEEVRKRFEGVNKDTTITEFVGVGRYNPRAIKSLIKGEEMTDQDVLNDIAKSLPEGAHYYIIDPQDRVIDGPWGKAEISRRFAACTIEGAAIAYWINQKWVRSLHYYKKVDEGHKETTIHEVYTVYCPPQVVEGFESKPTELKNDLGDVRYEDLHKRDNIREEEDSKFIEAAKRASVEMDWPPKPLTREDVQKTFDMIEKGA